MEAIRRAKQGAHTTQATRTPQGPQPYQLWTPGAVCSHKISYGKDKKPNLDSQNTLLYDCFCELNITPDKALDPLAYVHLSDREVGRLYLLVHMSHRALEYLSVTWPHVFDSKGALWEHREPQGQPFLDWREYSDPKLPKLDEVKRKDRTEYMVAHGNYILMGGGAWHKMRSSRTQHYLIRSNLTGTDGDATWSEVAHKIIDDSPLRVKDYTKPQVLGPFEHADSYVYQANVHKFAITVDPFRISPEMVDLIDAQARARCLIGIADVSFSLHMLRQTYEKDVPQPHFMMMGHAKLDPSEHIQEHWWVSHHTIKQRYLEVTKQEIRPAAPVANPDTTRMTLLETAHDANNATYTIAR